MLPSIDPRERGVSTTLDNYNDKNDNIFSRFKTKKSLNRHGSDKVTYVENSIATKHVMALTIDATSTPR